MKIPVGEERLTEEQLDEFVEAIHPKESNDLATLIEKINSKRIDQMDNYCKYTITGDRRWTSLQGEMMAIGYNQALTDIINLLNEKL